MYLLLLRFFSVYPDYHLRFGFVNDQTFDLCTYDRWDSQITIDTYNPRVMLLIVSFVSFCSHSK